MSEQWRPVLGYEGLYEVSDQGRVRRPGARLIAQQTNEKGYRYVTLWRLGVRAKFYVHHLVMFAFRGPRSHGLDILHGRDDKSDNSLVNLQWGTQSENERDKVRNGRHFDANKTECKHGHGFTPENTYVNKLGHRTCRKCRALRMATVRPKESV